MSTTREDYPKDVFTSVREMYLMEALAKSFSFNNQKHKVNSLFGGKHTSRSRGRGLDFEEVRKYVKGDDIRNIDWKVTARTQRTHTREFTEEKEKPCLLVVDQSSAMFFGSEKRTKAVVAAELAALSAFRVAQEGDSVGGVIFGDQGIDFIAPRRGKKNVLRLLKSIEKRNHELKFADGSRYESLLSETFARIKNVVTHDFLVVVISDFHRYNPKVLKVIAQLSQHNDLMVAKVMDPLERDIPNTNFVVSDGVNQLTVKGSKSAFQHAFTNGYDEGVLNFKAQLRKFKIPLLTFNTVDTIQTQIQDQVIKK